MSTYLASRQEDIFNQMLDGRLRGYCRGLVPLVQRVVSYGPKFWTRPVASIGKWLGNHTPHARYGPITPG
jgi:hypothetical protein